jgi:hypothetical protein
MRKDTNLQKKVYCNIGNGFWQIDPEIMERPPRYVLEIMVSGATGANDHMLTHHGWNKN